MAMLIINEMCGLTDSREVVFSAILANEALSTILKEIGWPVLASAIIMGRCSVATTHGSVH